MNSETMLIEAAETYLEETARAAQRKKMERLIYPLEMALRKAFREQGNRVTRGMRQLKRYFTEGGDPWQRHADMLQMHFSEAVPPSEWQRILADVELSTVKLFAAPIDAAVAKALELGGAAMLAELNMTASFSLKNPRAVDYVTNYGAELVKGINETTRGYLQTIITQATEEGWSYKRTAEAIIKRFEEFAIGKPQAHIDSRAHLIAVTETGNAYEQGNMIVAQDLAAAGLPMEKAWSTVGDGKVSEGCRQNEADGWIAVDKAHTSGHMRPLRFPGCRCEERYQVKEK